MNRAERRRQERAKRKGEAVYQVKQADIEMLHQRAIDECSLYILPRCIYASHPRKKKNALYRKVVKSIVKARGKKCPTQCVDNLRELGLVTYNVCLGCPYLFASPYHPKLKNTTLKRVKPDLKEILWWYGE